jgi:hypothetical protein
MQRLSGIFVESLKKDLEEKKNSEKYERSLLKDSSNFILNIIREENIIEIRSIKDFETSEISSSALIYTECENVQNYVLDTFKKRGIGASLKVINDKIFIFSVDLSGKIYGYRNKKNKLLIQFRFKGKHTLELKIFLKNSDPFYSVYEDTYFNYKIWIHCKDEFYIEDIPIKTIDRDSSEKTYSLSSKFSSKVYFHINGEVKDVNIYLRKGRKKNIDL